MGQLTTIGYEGRSFEDFTATLQANGVERVIDIRERPWSRKPGFSSSQLRTRLADCGIDYVHLRELGCPKPIRSKLRADSDYPSFFRAYESYLVTQEEALAKVTAMAQDKVVALLCFERNACECHRQRVADRLELEGFDPHHL
jgi:uncharacterized protein (DUF488 family)